MKSEKKKLDQMKVDQLSMESLKEVKGGIPYESPSMEELAAAGAKCGGGSVCWQGHHGDIGSCQQGIHCNTGDITQEN